MEGSNTKDSLLLDLPVRLSRQDYCSAVLLYQRMHGSPCLKKAMFFLIATAFSAMVSCVLFAVLAGGAAVAANLSLMILLFGGLFGIAFVLEQFFLVKSASHDYQGSELLRQGMAVRFYQYGIASLSPTGRHLILWGEIDGVLENKWGILFYQKNKIIALPGSVLDRGAADYLHGLLSVKLGRRYRIEQFVRPTGPCVYPPQPEQEKEEIPPANIFLEACAVQNSKQWRNRQKAQRLGTAAACGLLFGIFCFCLFRIFYHTQVCLVAGWIGFLLCFTAFLIFSIQKNKAERCSGEQVFFLRFAPAGIEYEQVREKFFIPWRMVNQVRRTPNGFLIEYDGCSSLWIEKKTLSCPVKSRTTEEIAAEIDAIFTRYVLPGKGR